MIKYFIGLALAATLAGCSNYYPCQFPQQLREQQKPTVKPKFRKDEGKNKHKSLISGTFKPISQRFTA